MGWLAAARSAVHSSALTRNLLSSRAMVVLPVLLVAAMLRLPGLGRAPLWYDETATARFAALPWDELLHGIARLEPNPPAFYAIEKLLVAISGFSDWSLRLPPAIFGLLGVLLVTLFTMEAFGRRAALWSGLLLAFQAQHIEYSREARVYSTLFACLALVTWFGWRVACRTRVADAWVLALAAAAAMVLHATGVVATAAAFAACAAVAIHGRGARARRLGLLAAAGAAALLAAAPTIGAMHVIARSQPAELAWIQRPDIVLTVQYLLSVLAAPVSGLYRLPEAYLPWAMAAAMAAVAGLLGWALWQGRRDATSAGLVVGLVTAVTLFYGLSQFVPFMLERTLLFILVFYLPLYGALLAASPVPARLAIVAMLLALQMPGIIEMFGPARHEEDWRRVAAALDTQAAASGLPVIVVGGFEALALERYQTRGAPGWPQALLLTEAGPGIAERLAAAHGAGPATRRGAGPSGFCKAIAGDHAALVVVRERPGLTAEDPLAIGTLLAAGGRPGPAWRTGRLVVQRWDQLCP